MDSGRTQLAGLQVLRAAAALLVVASHVLRETNAPDWLAVAGSAGVDVFMVISGFVMVYVTFPDGRLVETPASFFFKRLTRIAPFYWLICGFMLSLLALGFYQHLHPDIFRSLLFLPTEHRITIVSWTLVYEMYFYSLFALALFTRSRAGVILSTSAAIILLLYFGRVFPDATTADYLTRPISLEFCAGMGLAYVYQRWPHAYQRLRHIWIFGFIWLIASEPLFNTYYAQGWTRIWGWGLPAVLIVASMLSMRDAHNRFERSAVVLGDASYAIYLTHPLVVIVFDWINKHFNLFSSAAWPLVGIVLITLCTLAGVVTHFLVEKPLVRGVRKLGSAFAPAKTGSATRSPHPL